MKNILLIITLSIITSSVIAQSVTNLDSRKGFKHYKFGTSIKNYPNLKRYTTFFEEHGGYDPNHLTYIDSKNDNRVGNLEVSKINYSFVTGLLYSVQFSTTWSNGEELYRTFVELYGNPTKVKTDKKYPQRKHYSWTGNSMYLSLTLGIKKEDDPVAAAIDKVYGARVYYEYMPLDKKLQELKSNANSSAKNKLKSDL